MAESSPEAPVRLDPGGATRLTAVLAEAFALGVAADPLDPRGAQLRSLRPAIDNLAAALRAELALLDTSLTGVEADSCGEHWLARLLAEVERLAAQARALPKADAAPAGAAAAPSLSRPTP